MALQDLLNLSGSTIKVGLSEERIAAIVPVFRQYISYWREYPDMFVDFMQTGWDESRWETRKFKFFFYQRCFLRAIMRYKYCYFTFTRAYSKSFLSVMALMIRAILYPGAKLFATAGGKEQSAAIVEEKVEEICNLIPAFRKEIDWRRGRTQQGKDYCKYIFKNGSFIDNIVARESSRGRRRHAGLIEECVGVDGEILNSVIIPRYCGAQWCEPLMKTA